MAKGMASPKSFTPAIPASISIRSDHPTKGEHRDRERASQAADRQPQGQPSMHATDATTPPPGQPTDWRPQLRLPGEIGERGWRPKTAAIT